MARKKWTRQSNREYEERLRRERRQQQERRTRQQSGAARRNEASDSQKPRYQAQPSAKDIRRSQSRQAQQGQQAAGQGSRQKQQSGGYFEHTLVFMVIFLVMFGLLMLYAASIYTNSYFIKQCIFSLIGIVAMVIVSFIDYHKYARSGWLAVIVFGAIFSVIMIWSPLGVELNGARRWIGIKGITIQPAEIYKISTIILNAVLINRYNSKMKDWHILFLFLVKMIIDVLFIYILTQNLSSAIIVGMITVLMVFVAYPGYKLFIALGLVGSGLVGGVLYYILNIAGLGKGFRNERIIAWLAPERLEDADKVYQTMQALYSIGSGGLWGKGLGNGTQNMILPEAMNDMIFAIICEELGLLGAILVMVMFAIFLYRLSFIARNSKDLLGGMIVTGIFSHFMIQVILNIGVVTNLLPSTGVTLPFISAGGTALILLMAEVGMALNVSRSIDFEQPKLKRRRVQRSRT